MGRTKAKPIETPARQAAPEEPPPTTPTPKRWQRKPTNRSGRKPKPHSSRGWRRNRYLSP